MNTSSIRETAISVLNERIAELETLQSAGLAPRNWRWIAGFGRVNHF
jgi:hypothetical protein